MVLTSAQNQCLLALLALSRTGSDIASKDIAAWLGISRPSVHKRLEMLLADGLVVKTPYSKVRLSESGIKVAEELERRGRNLLRLFSEEIGLGPAESSAAVTLLMSSLSDESFQKFEDALAAKVSQ